MFRADNLPPPETPDDLCLVFQRGSLITDMRAADPCLIPRRVTRLMGWDPTGQQFLGYWHESSCFAVEIDPSHAIDPLQYASGNLYQLLGRVSEDMFAMAGRASQLLNWAKEHQHCGSCGQPSEFNSTERAMHCASCQRDVYPRINPCVIVLVTDGDRALLGRAHNFPPNMYSTLAGFIEAGESAEATVHREVREEVGVEVHNLRYYKSQSWPFPSQLMLGYFADYRGGDIVLQDEEIVDAQWFDYRELPMTPPAGAISGQLIEAWVASRGNPN